MMNTNNAIGTSGAGAVRDDGMFFPYYGANGQQKSAKPKTEARGGRDFEAARKRGVRSGIPRRNGNCHVTEYVDESGAVRAHYEYSPFGEIITQSGDLADTFRFRFSTKYHDPETEHYYYGRRFYVPVLGRWLNHDPVGEDGGLNLYGFVENNPVGKWDLLGLFDLPDSWLHDSLKNNMDTRTHAKQILLMLLAEIRSQTVGDDSWLPSFLALYFYGKGKIDLILSRDDVSSLATDPSLFLYSEEFVTLEAKKGAFLKDREILYKKSNRRFKVTNASVGNDTLGNFDVYYKGTVKNCVFTGHYRVEDEFKFNWDFNNGRAWHAEWLVRIFSLQFHGTPFRVESEWIPVTESWKSRY